MKAVIQFGCAVGLAVVAGSPLGMAQAMAAEESAQVLVLAAPSKAGGFDVSVDFYSDGRAVAVSVDLAAGDMSKAGASTAGCKTLRSKAGGNWQGGCSIVEGVARFVAVNFDMQPFPEGWHSLGTMNMRSIPKAGVQIKEVKAGDAAGTRLSVASKFTWVD